jgi:hypothetical protein
MKSIEEGPIRKDPQVYLFYFLKNCLFECCENLKTIPVFELDLERRILNGLYHAGIENLFDLSIYLLSQNSDIVQKYRNVDKKLNADICEALFNFLFQEDSIGNFVFRQDILLDKIQQTININKVSNNSNKLNLVDLGISRDQAELCIAYLQPIIYGMWCLVELEKELSRGRLHPNIKLDDGHTVIEHLSKPLQSQYTVLRLKKSLYSYLTIADELSPIIRKDQRINKWMIYWERRKDPHMTLTEIGRRINLTRERVRQIEARNRMYIVSEMKKQLNFNGLLRTQTAWQYAQSLGDTYSINSWRNILDKFNLEGDWTRLSQDIAKIFPSPAETSLWFAFDLQNQGNLFNFSKQRKLLLMASGTKYPDVREVAQREKLLRKVRMFIRHAGAVDIAFLAKSHNLKAESLRGFLIEEGFTQIDPNWVTMIVEDSIELTRWPFFSAVNRLLMGTGILGSYEIRDALRRISHKGIPPVPLVVIEQVLKVNGYPVNNHIISSRNSDEAEWHVGEKILLSVFNNIGSIVSHLELLNAMIASGRSKAYLYITLRKSPLFYRVEQGFYALRGRDYSPEDLENARQRMRSKINDIQISYDQDGTIHVAFNLTLNILADGFIISSAIPNMNREWECYDSDGYLGQIETKPQNITGLRNIFKKKRLHPGSKIKISFFTATGRADLNIQG